MAVTMKTHLVLTVLILVQATGILEASPVESGHHASARDHLVQDLLAEYHSSVEPSGVIELKFGLSLACFLFDKEHSTLKTSAWEVYRWHDFRLSWDSKEYDGIERLRLPASLIWKPDVDCYNALEAEIRTSENVIIDHDGEILWVPRAIYKTLCAIENNHPVCELSFGSWTYDQLTLGLELSEPGVGLNYYQNKTCPYVVESFSAHAATKHYPCCKEPYGTVDVTLHLKPNGPEETAAAAPAPSVEAE